MLIGKLILNNHEEIRSYEEVKAEIETALMEKKRTEKYEKMMAELKKKYKVQ
jgi:hypothetical protein